VMYNLFGWVIVVVVCVLGYGLLLGSRKRPERSRRVAGKKGGKGR